ncbi:hypothetical protein SAMN04487866_12510 [Thermoactinomyces sp. DSM 45891]|uniref:phage tail protein n=1 Tax=Thermoactinomyces sp. DSM 45891 TaxID=1761907 RepID=UPI0009218C96|nr:hypothetical protein [Thermoactinomyces sp. DSM 45891]SFX78138.1 hypothetical protein SAMN04487866_12510 [Thermoactinomyces sp. DSM 45891]
MSNKNMKRISRSLLILMIVLFTFGFVGQGVTYAVDFNIDNTPINGGFNQDIAQTSTATEKGWLESAGDWVSDKWDGFTDWCGELWDDVNNILDDLGAKIQDIMDTAWKWALAIGSAATLAWALLKKQIPALQVVEWAFSFIKGVLRGLADIVMGVFDLVVGALGLIGYIILNPIESGKKLGHWITHPGEVWNNISNMVGGVWNEITESWNRMVVNGDGNSRSEWLGYAATQIVGIFVGTKGLEKAGKAGSVVSKAGGISSKFPLASKAFDAIADSFKGFGDKVKSFGDNLFGNAKRILATTTAGAMLLTGITFVWPKIEPYIMKFSDCIAIQQQDAGHYFASMQLAGKIDCPSGKSSNTVVDDLRPGSPSHKAQRWEEYKDRDGEWSYDRWSKTYDLNMEKARSANQAMDAFHERLGWGDREVTIDANGQARRLDIADKSLKKGIEHKTRTIEEGRGYFSLSDHIESEVVRDAYLVKEQNWHITWVFENADASKPLQEELRKSNIDVKFIEKGGTIDE